MQVRWDVFAVTTSLAVAGCIGGADYAKHRRFDAQQWGLAVGDDRCEMVDDLRLRVGLDGKRRADVIALLGEPETHGEPIDHYHLCPSFADVWILEIQWENGRVASTRVRDT